MLLLKIKLFLRCYDLCRTINQLFFLNIYVAQENLSPFNCRTIKSRQMKCRLAIKQCTSY